LASSGANEIRSTSKIAGVQAQCSMLAGNPPMQLTPAQRGMSLMIHGSLPMMEYDSLAEGITRGRQQLMRITAHDYAYDLRAWHNYLIESNAGGC
jgi:hypothetical protein